MIHNNEQRKEARELYVRSKIRNLTQLEQLTGITRTTLRKWKDDENWDATAESLDVDPLAILSLYQRLEYKLLLEIEAIELSGQIPADTTLKRQQFYRKMAQSIDAQYDVNASVLRLAEKLIDFVSAMPDFVGKSAFVETLSKMLPKFIEYVIHGKRHS